MHSARFFVTRRRGEGEDGECCRRSALHVEGNVRGCDQEGSNNPNADWTRAATSEPNLPTFLLRPHTFRIPRWRPRCCDASYARVLQGFSRGLSRRPLPSTSFLQPRRRPKQPERRIFSIPTLSRTCRACTPLIFWRNLVPGKKQK